MVTATKSTIPNAGRNPLGPDNRYLIPDDIRFTTFSISFGQTLLVTEALLAQPFH
jgi:hypothetical protein